MTPDLHRPVSESMDVTQPRMGAAAAPTRELLSTTRLHSTVPTSSIVGVWLPVSAQRAYPPSSASSRSGLHHGGGRRQRWVEGHGGHVHAP